RVLGGLGLARGRAVARPEVDVDGGRRGARRRGARQPVLADERDLPRRAVARPGAPLPSALGNGADGYGDGGPGPDDAPLAAFAVARDSRTRNDPQRPHSVKRPEPMARCQTWN